MAIEVVEEINGRIVRRIRTERTGTKGETMDKAEKALNYKTHAPNMAAVVSNAANNLELAALRCVIDSRPPAIALRENLLPRLEHLRGVVEATIEIIKNVAPEKPDA